MRKNCWFWKQEQKDQKLVNTSQPSSNTKEGETIVVVSDGDVLSTILVEDACLHTFGCSIY